MGLSVCHKIFCGFHAGDAGVTLSWSGDKVYSRAPCTQKRTEKELAVGDTARQDNRMQSQRGKRRGEETKREGKGGAEGEEMQGETEHRIVCLGCLPLTYEALY